MAQQLERPPLARLGTDLMAYGRRAFTLDEVLSWAAGVMVVPGAPERPSRNGRVREIESTVVFQLRDPLRNLALLPHRRLNPWVTLAEFPWLLAGRNDVAWLAPYLPRASDFSDDGTTWRAGYGPRMRNWRGLEVDQLANVAADLRANPDSRRATLSIWDPAEDWGAYKDIPCTNWLHFYIRDGKLDLTVAIRSNDLIWGLSAVNVTNFTTLQQVMAACVGVAPGTYTHVASSLHVYDRHWNLLPGMARDTSPYALHLTDRGLRDSSYAWMRSHTYLDHVTKAARAALDWVTADRDENPTEVKATVADILGWMGLHGTDPARSFGEWAYFMSLHKIIAQAPIAEVIGRLETIARPDWALAAAAHVSRLRRNRLAAEVIGRLIEDPDQRKGWVSAAMGDV